MAEGGHGVGDRDRPGDASDSRAGADLAAEPDGVSVRRVRPTRPVVPPVLVMASGYSRWTPARTLPSWVGQGPVRPFALLAGPRADGGAQRLPGILALFCRRRLRGLAFSGQGHEIRNCQAAMAAFSCSA